MPESLSGGFGAKLREAREQRGISLEQIAATTRISIKALRALERNDIAVLPGGLFSRAFVRGYASQVGLDPEQTVREFIDEFPDTSVAVGHPASAPIDDNIAIESDRRMATAYVWMIAISVPIIIGLLYFGARSDEGTVMISSPPVQPSEASQSEPRPEATSFRPDAAADRVESAAAVPAASSDTLRVMLMATGPCWVSISADGRQIAERLMAAGDHQEAGAAHELLMTLGDPAAVAVTINGAAARTLGSAGRAVNVRLTSDNYRTYLATP
ncbi:MAG TPA: RodZ domain-containing protein [Vicinamibacterales bacterium]|nr:RodZ domain-containing protein [Vicinamibacterales bacterium]